ncbi:hypothetical protein RHMOL_Rhmol05G0128900 [Rhododendron molle]|uniref:Uncharacterized protein n=1 Tax=Rhododendron molle TaxID=49168 RepID=A0ACC0NNN0_RHOML|nr:hypothetical protein RHMOL_Rhmol05G0128900 [Rhododendron molle]
MMFVVGRASPTIVAIIDPNLPLTRYGKIRDLFIPNKTGKITSQKFGFVRFGSKEEASQAIEEVKGTWVWDYKLVPKSAKFSKAARQPQYNQQLQVEEAFGEIKDRKTICNEKG